MAKQWHFRKVEKLLYDYKYLNQAIANLEAELETIMPQATSSVVRLGRGGTKTSSDTSQTERWGIKRAESPRAVRLQSLLQEKRRQKAAIKGAREQLTDEENTFVWLRYDKEKQHKEIWEAMHMEGRSYYRFRRRVIEKVAKCIGLS